MRGTRQRPPRQPIDWSAMRPRDWWIRVAFIVILLGCFLVPVPDGWWSWVLVAAFGMALGCIPALPRKLLDASAPASTQLGAIDEPPASEIGPVDDEPALAADEFQAIWQQAKDSGARL